MKGYPRWLGFLLAPLLAVGVQAGSSTDPELPDPAADVLVPYTDLTGVWAGQNDTHVIIGWTLVDSGALDDGVADGEFFSFRLQAGLGINGTIEATEGESARNFVCEGAAPAGLTCDYGTYEGNVHESIASTGAAHHDAANNTWLGFIPRALLPVAPWNLYVEIGIATMPDPATPLVAPGANGMGDGAGPAEAPRPYRIEAPPEQPGSTQPPPPTTPPATPPAPVTPSPSPSPSPLPSPVPPTPPAPPPEDEKESPTLPAVFLLGLMLALVARRRE